MPALQVVDFNTEGTSLEKTLAGFSGRHRQNQVEKQENDALGAIYRDYKKEGGQLEDVLRQIQTKPGISPSKRLSAAKELIDMQRINGDLQKNQLREQEERNKLQAKEQADEQKQQQKERVEAEKKATKDREERLSFDAALDSVNKMKQIRKNGNLGRTAYLTQTFGSDTQRDMGEYTTLGNSLISYASNIPIRNRQEFEKLAGRISDPHITDAEAEGILDALERIISNSRKPFEDPNAAAEQPKQRRPLSDF